MYGASIRGKLHNANQDYYAYYTFQDGTKLAIVADGVSNASNNGKYVPSNSQVSSKFITLETQKYILTHYHSHLSLNKYKQLAAKTMHYVRSALLGYLYRENKAIMSERYLNYYHSTLAIALHFPNGNLVVANSGDSGCIALDYNHNYILGQKSKKARGVAGIFYPENYEINSYKNIQAFLLATDGILDCLYKKYNNHFYVDGLDFIFDKCKFTKQDYKARNLLQYFITLDDKTLVVSNE